MRKRIAHEQALWYEEELKKEIAKDREAHGKKPLKEKDDHLPPSSGGGNIDDTQEQEITKDAKAEKTSISDKESFFKKYEYVYDEYYDCYICPNNRILSYRTTNREGYKEIYGLQKETIERIFGTAKEQHGFRYTQYKGKAWMEMKAGLTFACMNLKKLAKILAKREDGNTDTFKHFSNRHNYFIKVEKLVWSFAPIPTLSTV